MAKKQDLPDQKQQLDSQPGRGGGAPPFWEWVVAGVGLVLILASLGFLTYHGVSGRTSVPAPVVQRLGVEQQGNRFLVLVRVDNRGRSAAEGLTIAGQLKRNGEVVERSETVFQFLPGESSRDGGLFFSRDPRSFELELMPVSYQTP